MGIFDLFKGRSARVSDEDAVARDRARSAARWAERAADKRAQNYDRQEAIHALANQGTADAAAALLKRFSFTIEPSITDQEEKDAAFEGILRAGQEAILPIRSYATKAESLAWPIRLIKELLTEEEYVQELLTWLSRWDPEYSKFVDPKLQIIATLSELRSPAIVSAVQPFLDDVNEPARFLTVGALLAQDDPTVAQPLLALLAEEESLRIKNRIAEAFAQKGWLVGDELRDATRKSLPHGFSIDAQGAVLKREGLGRMGIGFD